MTVSCFIIIARWRDKQHSCGMVRSNLVRELTVIIIII